MITPMSETPLLISKLEGYFFFGKREIRFLDGVNITTKVKTCLVFFNSSIPFLDPLLQKTFRLHHNALKNDKKSRNRPF